MTSLKKLPKNPNSDHYAFEISFEQDNKTVSEIYRVRHLGSRAKWFESIKQLWKHFNKNEPMPRISKHKILFVDDSIGIIQELNKKRDNSKVSMKDFKIVKSLGFGAFSCVYLVRHRTSNKLYAMKVMDKNILIEQKHLHYIITEFNVLKRVTDCPFILSLHYVFQTANYLYMVVDYCSKGDITHLETITKPKVLFAELILAFEYLHKKNIIYRDLKPENILLSQDGHIKLCDFNLAKENIDDHSRALSFCGSPMYLSPEMLGQNGVNKSADVYGIGLIIYEILTGKPAYYTTNPQELYSNIAHNRINFNEKGINPVQKDLLKRILVKEPKHRFTLEQIKHHEFFNDINWEQIANLTGDHITIKKKPQNNMKPQKIPERVHNITKREIKKDEKREMKNCVRNFFYSKVENEEHI